MQNEFRKGDNSAEASQNIHRGTFHIRKKLKIAWKSCVPQRL